MRSTRPLLRQMQLRDDALRDKITETVEELRGALENLARKILGE